MMKSKLSLSSGAKTFWNQSIFKYLSLVVIVMLLGLNGVMGQAFTGTYSFSGTTGHVASLAYNGSAISNLTVGALTKNGVTTQSSNGNSRADGWGTGSTNGGAAGGSIDLGKYFEFTITAGSGFTISNPTITFGVGRSGTGPRRFQWRSSIDTYGSALSVGTVNSSITHSSGVLETPDANAGYTGNVITITTTGQSTITIRFYAYGAEGTTGTGGLQGDLSFGGTLVASASTPTLTTPTATSITDVSATLGATVTADGGSALSARGTSYKTSSPVVAADNQLAEGGTSVAAFSHSRTSLTPQTQYFYAGYATNTTGTGLSTEGNFRTLSTAPSAQSSGVSTSVISSSQINLTITAATFPGSGATQAGYVVIYSTGTPTLSSTNGQAPAAGVGTIFATSATNLPSAPSTAANVTGLATGTTYNFLVVPYTWDGTNAATYNYLTTSAPTANATTSSGAPALSTPTVSAITHNSATLGATVTSDGGSALSARGTSYKTSSPVIASDNQLAEGGTSVAAYTHSRTGLSSETQYFYAGYATNSSSTTLSSEGNFRTLSSPPTVQAGLSATAFSTTQINLTISAATFPGSGATQAGYVVIYATGTPTFTATNGQAPAAGVGSIFATSATVLPATPSTTVNVTGLTQSTLYNFLVVPYTWDGTNATTYNYLTTSAPTANATTQGPVNIAIQDFETSPATPTLTFTNTLGSNSTGDNGSGLPASANLFVSGSRGWQAVNQTSVVTFANQSLSGYTDASIGFRLAGMSVSGTNGIDGADIVTVAISVDGGTTYSNELTIAGSAANQRWDFTATGTSTITYDGDNTPTAVTSSSGSGGISTVTINIPNSNTQVRVRITLFNNDNNERWVMDDVRITGTLAATPSIALSSPTIPSSDINNNTTNNIIGAVQLAVTTANATLTGATFTTSGTYTAADIATNGFKFWLSTSPTDISGATQLGAAQAAATTGSPISVSGLNNVINEATTRYVVLTADMVSLPTNGATIGISTTAHANITFFSGNKTGTDPVVAGTTRTIANLTPSIAISGNHPTASNINQNAVNQVFGSIALAVTTANTTLNSITITTGGTYQISDLVASSFKLYYTTTNSFATSTQLGSSQAIVATGNTVTFSGLTQTINSGTTGYLWFTVDVAYNSVNGRTLSTNTTTFSNITFDVGSKTGTDPVVAGNNHTITTVTPNITIAQAGPSVGTIANGTTNQILYQLSFAAADNATDLNSITLTTAGTYIPADLVSNSFKLWYNSANNLTGATQIGSSQAIVTTGNNISFSGLTQKLDIGTSYILMTVDVDAAATAGNTINISTTNFSNITLSTGNKLGTDPATAGGVKTFAIDVAVGAVVINQISPDYNGASNEYIELVNKTAATIDLSTLKIAYQSSTGTLGGAGATLTGSLPPYSFWLLSPDATITVGLTSSLPRDGSFSAGFAATNGQVALQRVSDNTIIDAVGYGTLSGGTFSEGTASSNPTTDGGLRRVTDGADANANNTDFTTVTNANIYLRNSSSRLGVAGSTIAAGTYTDFVVTGNTSLGGAVNVTNRLDVVSGTLTTGGNLTLKSTASRTANVTPVGGSISGNITVERYIPAARKFRFLAHPFSSAQNLDILTDDIDITGNPAGTTDGSAKALGTGFTATTGSVIVNNPSAFRFSTADANGNASDGGWRAFTAADGSGANNTWGVGQGIRVLIRGAKGQGLDGNAYTPSNVTLDMTGAVNTGDVNVSLVTGGTGATAGFNLVGNPYPSPVDLSAVVFASAGVADINKTVYTRNPQTGSYTTQLLVNATPYNIPSYAAVFIQNTGAGSVTLPFTEARKATTSGLTTFKTGQTNIALFEFKIGGVVYDNLNLGFDENANAVFEAKYDAIKLNNDSFNFSSLTSNGEYVCTDIRPFINEGKIKLFTNIKSGSTEVEMSISTFNLPNGKDLFLVDNFTNKTIKVDSKFKYNFLIDANNQSTFGAERFYLTTSIGTSIKELSNASFFTLYPNPATDQLNIALSTSQEGNYSYTIFNQLGQVASTGEISLINGKPAGINTQDLNNGIYFIQLSNGDQSQTIKFIK